MNCTFGGYFFESGSRVQLEIKKNPDDEAISSQLEIFSTHDGVGKISVDPEPDAGLADLTLYAERGRYLLMLKEILQDGDINIRTIHIDGASNGFEVFFGENYPDSAVTNDINVVIRAFSEFAKHGNVESIPMR